MKYGGQKLLQAFGVVLLLLGADKGLAETKKSTEAVNDCAASDDCIGMVIDSGDPILIQMGHEMSNMVSDGKSGTKVKPTAGPIANVARMMSRENAGLSVVPSDMLLYTRRSNDPMLKKAEKRLRFIMTIGEKVVHIVAREGIDKIEDLDGKRVVMGPDNTAIWVVANNILALHDVTPSEKIQLKPADGVTAVLLDQADAAFVVGNAPLPVIQKLADLRQGDVAGVDAEKVHLLEIKLPGSASEYKPLTVAYPGLVDELDTVAILPTLVSYDFTHKKTPYFRRRCEELAGIGDTIRNRLEELRKSGHEQWNATTWELTAGNWERDDCFLGNIQPVQVASSVNADVQQVQQLLNDLGYNVGSVDGIIGPKTRAGLKQFQTDRQIEPTVDLNPELVALLSEARDASVPAATAQN
ncbi:MAG: TAXI family TRAP transporter solute-binding subunit [Stappiaceae bacterium]